MELHTSTSNGVLFLCNIEHTRTRACWCKSGIGKILYHLLLPWWYIGQFCNIWRVWISIQCSQCVSNKCIVQVLIIIHLEIRNSKILNTIYVLWQIIINICFVIGRWDPSSVNTGTCDVELSSVLKCTMNLIDENSKKAKEKQGRDYTSCLRSNVCFNINLNNYSISKSFTL